MPPMKWTEDDVTSAVENYKHAIGFLGYCVYSDYFEIGFSSDFNARMESTRSLIKLNNGYIKRGKVYKCW